MDIKDIEQIFNNIEGEITFPTIYTDMVKRFPSGSTFVEVGTYKGKSLAFLMMESLKQNKEFRITGVDNFIGCVGVNDVNLRATFWLNMFPVFNNFTLLDKDSINASKCFDNKSIDFVFIDGAHDYASVCKDIRAWLPKVKKGGIIAGHDYKTMVNIDVGLAVHDIFGKKIIEDYTHEYCLAYEVNT